MFTYLLNTKVSNIFNLQNMLGKTISHYKILDKLGEGGMGVVYKAEDTKLKRFVALKFLPTNLTQDDDANKRFIREARAASALDHPNICVIHAIEQTDGGETFICMAHYDGETLKDKIQRGPLPADEAIGIAGQIANGLARAHEAGIIHRDIKPGNVIITERDEVKILDFGLAKLAGQSITKSGSTLGTVAYMSPEQVQGQTVDARTDVWALGVVLYEMLSGELPFKGDYDPAIQYSILHQEPESVDQLRQDVPDGLAQIFEKTLAKKPQERYQHAGDLGTDLKRTLRGRAGTKRFSFARPSWLFRFSLKQLFMMVTAFVAVTAVALTYFFSEFDLKDGTQPPQQIMLAVLPFDNLGEPEDAYFADGITDEILTKLSTIPELGVIARQSAFRYRGDEKSIAEIGKELGVEYILRGAIRWQRTGEGPSQVRITPKLISVADSKNVWASTYDSVLDDIFVMQANIAEQVSQELSIALAETKRQTLRKRPTKNLEAYNYYLRAAQIKPSSVLPRREVLPLKQELYEKAIALDANFALAHAKLSSTHSRFYWYGVDQSLERLEEARKSFERAFAIDPSLPATYFAKGWYFYWGLRDYQTALKQFEIGNQLAPNRRIYPIGVIKRRLGYFEDATELIKRASILDPSDYNIAFNLAQLYRHQRMFQKAEQIWEQYISVWPEHELAYDRLANMYIDWEGNTERARKVLAMARGRVRPDHLNDVWQRIYRVDGNLQKALDHITFNSINPFNYYRDKAFLYHFLGLANEMKTHADSARAIGEKRISSNPNLHYYHSELGQMYALLGRKEDAIRQGEKAVELLPVSKDAYEGPRLIYRLAVIYVLVGEYEAAIDKLEYLLSIHSFTTVPRLKVEPEWAPLREHPRFQKLLSQGGYSSK